MSIPVLEGATICNIYEWIETKTQKQKDLCLHDDDEITVTLIKLLSYVCFGQTHYSN